MPLCLGICEGLVWPRKDKEKREMSVTGSRSAAAVSTGKDKKNENLKDMAEAQVDIASTHVQSLDVHGDGDSALDQGEALSPSAQSDAKASRSTRRDSLILMTESGTSDEAVVVDDEEASNNDYESKNLPGTPVHAPRRSLTTGSLESKIRSDKNYELGETDRHEKTDRATATGRRRSSSAGMRKFLSSDSPSSRKLLQKAVRHRRRSSVTAMFSPEEQLANDVEDDISYGSSGIGNVKDNEEEVRSLRAERDEKKEEIDALKNDIRGTLKRLQELQEKRKLSNAKYEEISRKVLRIENRPRRAAILGHIAAKRDKILVQDSPATRNSLLSSLSSISSLLPKPQKDEQLGSSDESSDTQKVEGPEQGRGRTRQSLQISVQRKLGQMLLSPLFAWLVFALFTCVGVSLQSWLMWSSGTKGYTRLLHKNLELRARALCHEPIQMRFESSFFAHNFMRRLQASNLTCAADKSSLFVPLAEAFDLKGSNESRAGDVRASVRIETLRDGNRDSLLLNWSSPEIHTVFIHGPQGGNVTHSSVSLGLNF